MQEVLPQRVALPSSWAWGIRGLSWPLPFLSFSPLAWPFLLPLLLPWGPCSSSCWVLLPLPHLLRNQALLLTFVMDVRREGLQDGLRVFSFFRGRLACLLSFLFCGCLWFLVLRLGVGAFFGGFALGFFPSLPFVVAFDFIFMRSRLGRIRHIQIQKTNENQRWKSALIWRAVSKSTLLAFWFLAHYVHARLRRGAGIRFFVGPRKPTPNTKTGNAFRVDT